MLAIIVLIGLNFALMLYMPIAQLFVFFLLVAFMKRRRSLAEKREQLRRELGLTEGEAIVGLFHPYCNAGGGGERVLWVALRALQIHYGDRVRLLVYTGDLDAYKEAPGFDSSDAEKEAELSQADKERLAGEAILAKVERTTGLKLEPGVRFVFLAGRDRINPARYPRFTLLRQSIGGALLGLEAIGLGNPDVMIDTMGCHFAGAIFRYLGGCKTACYVHYPLISTDMIEVVNANSLAVNNPQANSAARRAAKLIYYRLFAQLYGWFGRCWHLVMTNSSWTRAHIASLWGADTPRLLYPPVCLEEFAHLPVDSVVGRLPLVLSIAQFRPEKDHQLQLRAFAKFLRSGIASSGSSKPSLVLIGGCRNDEDRARVDQLRCLADELGIADWVKFEVNAPYDTLKAYLEKARVGLHSMRDEHFGIGIVDMMAAGVTVVAHNSGGPKLDIVTEPAVGFLATTEDEYAQALADAFQLDGDQLRARFLAVRRHIARFSERDCFMPDFCKLVHPLVDYRGGDRSVGY